MGKHPKKLFTLALVLLLIAILSMATLAWFNTTEVVTNTFYIGAAPGTGGGEDPEKKPPFDFNVFGQRQDTDHDPEYYEYLNAYSNVLPASVLDKKLYFENTGTYSQWIRLHLIFSDREAWLNALEKAADYEGMDDIHEYATTKLLGGLNENLLWEDPLVHNDLFGTTDTMTYTFYYKNEVKSGDSFLIMDTITIPAVLDAADMAAFGPNGFAIRLKGEALQADELPEFKDAKEAFAYVEWATGQNKTS